MALAVLSCQKPVEYPIEPKIAYEGFTYLMNPDSTFSGQGIISFSYTDGDGDLGLNEADTLPPTPCRLSASTMHIIIIWWSTT